MLIPPVILFVFKYWISHLEGWPPSTYKRISHFLESRLMTFPKDCCLLKYLPHRSPHSSPSYCLKGAPYFFCEPLETFDLICLQSWPRFPCQLNPRKGKVEGFLWSLRSCQVWLWFCDLLSCQSRLPCYLVLSVNAPQGLSAFLWSQPAPQFPHNLI